MVALFRFILLALALAAPTVSRAEQQDIAAAARGVVRVVQVATDGSRRVTVQMWNGTGYDSVIDDRVGAAS